MNKTHVVRNPFYCRHNQFARSGFDGQVLVVGISVDALVGETYQMTIGKRNKTIYEAPVADIKLMGQAWINPKGKTVIIAPVEIFQKKQIAP